MRNVGRYQLVTRLGSGTLGDVFFGQVEQPRISEVISGSVGMDESPTVPSDAPPPGTRWAIKVIKPTFASDTRIQRLLTTEGQTALSFSDPSVVGFHEMERSGEDLYMRFDLVGGQTLASVLKKLQVESEPLSHRLICHVGATVAAALAQAHERPWFAGAPGRFVLGTLAPRRVMVTYEGQVKLVGLGRGRARLSQPLGLATLSFASPEVAAGRDPTPRSDIYALGVVLYYALTGRQIFRRGTEEATRAAIKEANVPTLNSRNLKVDPSVGDLIAEMMAPRVDARPESMASIASALKQAAGDASQALQVEIAEVMKRSFADEHDAFARMTDAATRATAPRGSPSVIITPPQAPAAAIETLTDVETERSEGRTPAPRQESRMTDVQKAQWTTDDLEPIDDTTTLADTEPSNAQTAERITEPDRPSPMADGAPNDRTNRRRVARYAVERVIATSDVGSMYVCRDPNVARRVMVKVLDPRTVTDPRLTRSDWVRLFKIEARIAGRMSHEGFPFLYDAGRDDGAYFMTLEYLEGESLAQRLNRGDALTSQQIKRLTIELARALQHMHERGWVHADVRPSNIMLSAREQAKLVDFSLSSAIEGGQHPLIQSNLLAAAPELLNGGRYTGLSEQFALGMLLYQLLVGTRPFRGIEDQELQDAIRTSNPQPPQVVSSGVDPLLSEVCMRLLEKEPAARFSDMAAVTRRLEGTSEDSRPQPPPPSPVATVLEHDTDPMIAVPPKGDIAPVLLVDPALDHPLGHQLFDDAVRPVGLYSTVDAALERLETAPAEVLVIAKDAIEDEDALQDRLANLPSGPDVRIVAPAKERLLGSTLDVVELVEAFVGICERVSTLSTQDFGHRATSDAPSTARSVSRRLGLSLSAQTRAALAIAVRDLADRMRLSVHAEDMQALVPRSLFPLFENIDRVKAGELSADQSSLLAQVVALVEVFFHATRPRDGRQRTSPRRAVLAIREEAERRYRPAVVEALVEHLREVISALDLSPVSPDAPRILVAGIEESAALLSALEFDGYSIDEAEDGHVAWEKLRKDAYSGAIVDASLPGRDGLSLVKLCRAHPDTSEVAFLILGGEKAADGQKKVATLERSAAIENIRQHVGRLIK